MHLIKYFKKSVNLGFFTFRHFHARYLHFFRHILGVLPKGQVNSDLKKMFRLFSVILHKNGTLIQNTLTFSSKIDPL
jgi:hypothetical protein